MAKMPSILEYTKRVGRSMAYGAFDAIKETMPMTSALVENNTQTAKDLFKDVTQSKSQLNRLKTMQDQYLFKPANQLMKNLKADLKSGNFYHPERAAKAEEQGAQDMMRALLAEEGMEDLMDLLNGSDEASPEDMEEMPVKAVTEVTTGDAVVASTIAKEQRRATHASVDAQTKLAEAQIATQKTLANMSLRHMEKHTNITVQGFGKMTEGFNSLMQFNQEVILQHAKNSQQFYTEMHRLTSENNAILKEFIEMKRAQFKSDSQQEAGGSKNPFANGGVFNLKDYLDVVKSNLDNSLFGMVGMLLAGIPAMISGIVANPVHFASKQIMKGFLGPALRTVMKGFDKNINGLLQTGLAKLANWGNSSESGLLGELGKIFGIQTKSVSARNVDMSKALKGPRQWDAEDHHFLTKVIPSYLSNIEAALSGREARHFSTDTGKWSTTSMMKKKYRAQEQIMADTNTAELQKYLKETLYATLNIDPNDKNSAKNVAELNGLIRDFAMGVQKQGGLGVGVGENAHYKDILKNENKVYGDNENILKLIYDLVKRADTDQRVRSIVLGTNSKVIGSKHDQAQRFESGNLTDAEKWIATNSDLGSKQLRAYDELSMALAIAEAQGDKDRANNIRKVLNNIGSENTSLTSNTKKLKGGTRQTDNISSPIANNPNMGLLDWQAKIYEVLVDIRDGRNAGQPSKYTRRGKASKKKKKGGNRGKTTSTTSSDDDEDAAPDWYSVVEEIIKETRTGEGALVRNAAYDVLLGRQMGIENNSRTSMATGNLGKILRDSDAADKFRVEMNRNFEKSQKGYKAKEMEYESGIMDSVLGSDMSEDEINKKLRSYNVDPKDGFFKQLAAAGTLGQKMGVISANINKLIASPRAMLTSVIGTADKLMYELIFGKDTGEKDENGMPIKGFFGKMLHEMDKAGISLNQAISDIANKISNNKDKWKNQAKGFVKDVFGLDIDSAITKAKDKLSFVGNQAKDAAKSVFGGIKSSVTGTIKDIREGNFNQQNKGTVPGKAFGQYPAIVSKGEAVINSDGSGSKNVTRSGVTTIGDDSIVIPSNRNPWNPSRLSANPRIDYQNENRIRNRITSRIKGSNGTDYASGLPGFASGKDDILSVIKSLSAGEAVQAVGPILGMLQRYGVDPSMAMNVLADYAGGKAGGLVDSLNLTPDDKQMLENVLQRIWHSKTLRNNPAVQQFAERGLRAAGYQGKLDSNYEMLNQDLSRQTGVFNGMQQFALQATGTDPIKAADEMKKYIVKNTPELMKGGMAGALLGTVFPLGGPLMGAAAGAAVSLLSNNKTFMDYMFGEEIVDESGNKTGERKENGLISAKFVKSLEKYIPDAKKYGIAGSLLGAVTGFGPLGGVMAGIAASYIKNNESANKFIFGDKGGLLNKDRKKAIKDAIPKIGAGVLSTMLLGPFGLLGNAALGAGIGLLTTTELFQTTMLGAKDKNGVRHGGIAGAIRRHITNPLKENAKVMKKDFAKWFRDDVTKPLGKGLKPIADEVKNILKKGSKSIVDSIEGVLRGAGGTKMERFLDFTFGGIRKAGGFSKWLAQNTVGRAVGGIAKGVESFGNAIRDRQLGNAEITDRSSAEILKEMEDRGIKNNPLEVMYRKMANNEDSEQNKIAELMQSVAGFYDQGTSNAIARKERDEFDHIKSTISRITENPKYTKNATLVHGNLMKLAGKMKDGEAIDQAEVGKKLKEIMHKSGFSVQDRKEIEEAFMNGSSVFGSIKRGKEWRENNDSKSVSEALDLINREYFDNNLSREQLIELMPNLAEFAGNEVKNRKTREEAYKAKAAANGEVADTSVYNPQKDIEVRQANNTAVSDLTKSINYLTAYLTGENPSQIAKSLNLVQDLRSMKVSSQWNQEYMRSGLEKGEASVNKKVSNNIDRLNSINAFSTTGNLSEETADYLMVQDDKNTWIRSFLELNQAKQEGNTAIVKDIEAIFQIDESGKLFSRITRLTIVGFEVDPKMYEDIEDLNDDEFDAAYSLVQMKVPVSDFKIFKGISKETAADMVKFAGAELTLKDGSTTQVGQILIADEINKLLNDSAHGEMLKDRMGLDPSMSFLNEYFSGSSEYSKPFQKSILESQTKRDEMESTFKTGGLSGERAKEVQSDISNAQIGGITGKYEGLIGAAQTVGNAALDASKWALEQLGSGAIKVADISTGRLKLGTNLTNAAKYGYDYLTGTQEHMANVNAFGVRALENKFVFDPLLEKVSKLLGDKAMYMTMALIDNPKEAYDIVKAVGSGELEPAEAIKWFKEYINPENIGKIEAEEKAKEMPQHGLGKMITSGISKFAKGFKKGGIKGATKGMFGGALAGTALSSLFGGDDDDKSKDESDESDEEGVSSGSAGANANMDSAGGISADLGTALGAAAGFVNSGQQVMGSMGMPPLERGQKIVIPTAFGPKVYTTSSTDGGMMEMHSKDNTEVDEKERADIDRKERVVSALEKISGKMGDVGKVKKNLNKATGGLLDSILGLASLPFTVLSGLVNSLGGLPIVGPIIMGTLGVLSTKFGNIGKKLGLDLGQGAAKAGKKAATKPGLAKSVIKGLFGSKMGKFLLLAGSVLGINLLSDSKAEASTVEGSDEDKDNKPNKPGKSKNDDSVTMDDVYKDITKDQYKDQGFIGKTVSNIKGVLGAGWDTISNHPILSALGIGGTLATAAGINGKLKGGGTTIGNTIIKGIPKAGKIGKFIGAGAALLAAGSAGKAIYDNSEYGGDTQGQILFDIHKYPDAYRQFGELSNREQAQCDAYMAGGKDVSFILNWLTQVRQINGGKPLSGGKERRTKNQETMSSAWDTGTGLVKRIAVSTASDQAARLFTKASPGSVKHSLISGGINTAYRLANGEYEDAWDAAKGLGLNVATTYGINKAWGKVWDTAQSRASNEIMKMSAQFANKPEFKKSVKDLMAKGMSETEAIKKVTMDMAEKNGIKAFSKQGVAGYIRKAGSAFSHLGTYGKVAAAGIGAITAGQLTSDEGSTSEFAESAKHLGGNLIGAKMGDIVGGKLGGRWGRLIGTVTGGQIGGVAAGGEMSVSDAIMDAGITGWQIYKDWRNPENMQNLTPDQVQKMEKINTEVQARQSKIDDLKKRLEDPNLSKKEKGKLNKQIKHETNKIKNLTKDAEKITNSAKETAKAAKDGAKAGSKATADAAKSGNKYISALEKKAANASDTVKKAASGVVDAAKKYGDKGVDAAKSAGKAIMETAENRGIMSKVREIVTTIKTNICKYMPGGTKCANFVSKACDTILDMVKKPEIFKKIAAGIGKESLKFVPVIGWVVGAGFVAYGAYKGYDDADKLLEIPEGSATTSMKVFCMFLGAVFNAPILALVPTDIWFKGLMKVCDAAGFTPDDLQKLRNNKKKDDADQLKAESDEFSKKVTGDIMRFGAANNPADQKQIEENFRKTDLAHKDDPRVDWKKRDEFRRMSQQQRMDSMRKSAEDEINRRQGSNDPSNNRRQGLIGWLGEKWDNWNKGKGKYGRGDREIARQDIGPMADMSFNMPGDTEKQTVGDSACAAYSLENAFNGLEGKDPSGRRIGSLVQESIQFKHKDDGVDPQFIHNAATSRGYQTKDLHNQSEFGRALNSGQKVIGMGQGNKGPWGPGMHYEQFEKGSKPGYAKVYDSEESEVREYPIKDIYSGMSNAISVGKGKYGRSRYGRGIRRFGRDNGKDNMSPEEIAIEISKNTGLPPELIWAQMAHETGNFTSELAKEHNYGGVKNAQNSKDKSGKYSWKVVGEDSRSHSYFDCDRSFVNYMSWYYPLYKEDGLLEAKTPADWAAALKHGGYYTDSEDNYRSNIEGILNSNKDVVQRLRANAPSTSPISGSNGPNRGGNNANSGPSKASDAFAKDSLFGKFFEQVNNSLNNTIQGKMLKAVNGSSFGFGKGKYGREKSNGPNDVSKLWEYLKQRGVSNVSAAGMLGNFQRESGLYSDRLQDHSPSNGSDECPTDGSTGYGLAQWTDASRQRKLKDFMKSKGLPDSDYKGQLDLILSGQDRDVSGIIKRMDESKDPQKAADIWEEEFEGSDDRRTNNGGIQERMRFAKAIFDSEGKGTVDGNSNISGSSSSSSGSSQDDSLFGKFLSQVDNALNNTTQGKMIKAVFGSSFSFSNPNAGSNGSSGSSGGYASFGGGNISEASKWAESMVNTTGYGNNGCTEFVKRYLKKAGHKLGDWMEDCSPIKEEVAEAAKKAEGGHVTLMWVPTLEQWAKDKGYFKDASQGGAEGDVCVCNDHGHVIIADGKGGYWGNSSSKNQIVHGESISAHYSSVQGYITTGSGNAVVSNDKTTRSQEEMNADAGSSNANVGKGKYGRSKYGRNKTTVPVAKRVAYDNKTNTNGNIGKSIKKAVSLGARSKGHISPSMHNYGTGLFQSPDGRLATTDEMNVRTAFGSDTRSIPPQLNQSVRYSSGPQISNNVDFTELLEEQRKTNNLLAGILNAIVANGEIQKKANVASGYNSSVMGNRGYMGDLNGKPYTPIARSLDWMSEPK